MHKSFADWYRTASIEPDNDLLQRRWSGLEALTSEKPIEFILDAARVLFGFKPRGPTFMETFIAAFKSADAAFPTKNNEAELQVLAGAYLCGLVLDHAAGTSAAASAALAIECASFAGTRPPRIVPEFLPIATTFLQKEAVRARRFPVTDVDVPKSVLETIAAATPGNPQASEKAFKDIAAQLSNLVGAIRLSQKTNAALAEELDILWWLVGGRTLAGDPFESLGPAERSFTIAHDLATLTRYVPGPFSTPALLARSLTTPDVTISLDAVVGALKKESMRIGVPHEGNLGELTPVLLAVSIAIQREFAPAWRPAFTKASGLTGKKDLTSIQLARQAYNELLLIRQTNA